METQKDVGEQEGCHFATVIAAARLVRWKTLAEHKSLAAAATLREKFKGCDASSPGTALSREKLTPRVKSVVGSIVAMRNGFVKLLRIVDRGEDGAIALHDIFVRDVGLTGALARKRGQEEADTKWRGRCWTGTMTLGS